MINDHGEIPTPLFVLHNGKKSLMVKRPEKNLMKKFDNAVGISTSVLKELDERIGVLVYVEKNDGSSDKYFSNVSTFNKSSKSFMNDGYDEQKFVSIKNMQKVEDNKWW